MDNTNFNRDSVKSNTSVLSSLDPVYCSDHLTGPPQPRSLLDTCMDKILSDAYFLRHSEGKIPASLQINLLFRAMETFRVPSVKYLLERYPVKDFVLRVPDTLKHCSVSLENTLSDNLWTQIVQTRNNAILVGFCFLHAIKNKNRTWRTVDFSQLPLNLNILVKICTFIKEENLNQDQYEVKGNFIFLSEDDYTSFCDAMENLNTNLKISLTGIHISYIPEERLVTDVLKIVDAEDMRYLYVGFICQKLPELIGPMYRFENLTALYLTYILTPHQRDFDALADLIYRLPLLNRLCLSGSVLKNHLAGLLLKNCKSDGCAMAKRRRINSESNQNEYKSWFQPDCCVLHRGKLENLDLSGCALAVRDLECLKRYPLCDNLKCLDVADNTFEANILAKFLESFVSNLIALDVGSCMKKSTILQPFFNVLEKFKSLEYVLLGQLPVDKHQVTSLNETLLKMPNLKEVRMCCPNNDEPEEEEVEALFKLKESVNLVWQRTY